MDWIYPAPSPLSHFTVITSNSLLDSDFLPGAGGNLEKKQQKRPPVREASERLLRLLASQVDYLGLRQHGCLHVGLIGAIQQVIAACGQNGLGVARIGGSNLGEPCDSWLDPFHLAPWVVLNCLLEDPTHHLRSGSIHVHNRLHVTKSRGNRSSLHGGEFVPIVRGCKHDDLGLCCDIPPSGIFPKLPTVIHHSQEKLDC